jgi:gas vesicle protein
MSKNGLGKFVLGASLGAGLALLFAPMKGSDLRRGIKKKFDEFIDDVEDLSIAEIKKEFTDKVEEIKKGIEELDKEKVMKIAKKKGEELKEKATELVELAKEKGTPVLEGVAEDIREKTVAVAKEVVEKLEK